MVPLHSPWPLFCGDLALAQALEQRKRAGAITVVMTHRTKVLAQADKILVLRDGAQLAFGPRDEILANLQKAAQQAAAQHAAAQQAAQHAAAQQAAQQASAGVLRPVGLPAPTPTGPRGMPPGGTTPAGGAA